MREHERHLWTLLSAVETHTLSRYAASVPALDTPGKRAAVEAISGLVPDDATLEGSPLELALPTLLEAAEGDGSALDALLVQGLVLEHLGTTLYEAVQHGDRLDSTGTAVANTAARASSDARERAVSALCAQCPDTTERFYAFTARTHGVFQHLDTLGIALDETFAGPLNLRFADLMGDFVADLLPICTGALGFDRRRVMVHLSAALMA